METGKMQEGTAKRMETGKETDKIWRRLSVSKQEKKPPNRRIGHAHSFMNWLCALVGYAHSFIPTHLKRQCMGAVR